MFWVYVLKGTKYYVWFTNNLSRRIWEHSRGNSYFTKRIWEVVELIGYFEFEYKEDAMKFETEIKKSWHIERYVNHEKFVWVSSSIG